MEATSILASIASPVSILLVPVCGIAAWQLAAAAITGFIAKENVVGIKRARIAYFPIQLFVNKRNVNNDD